MQQPRRAIALRYEKNRDAAPRVVAKGAGEVAKAIIQTASNSHVPVMENQPLVDSLIQLEVGSVIPEELYTVVAELLAYVYQHKNT